jgi:hypothetical protein
MALDFPNSPTLNQFFPATPLTGVPTWIWDGSEWTIPPLIPKVVTVNATGTKLYNGTAVTSLNYTGLTIAAGSNLAMVVTVHWDTTGTTPTAMTMVWDSGGANQSLTQIVTSDPGTHSQWQAELWGLVNPVVGNKTLSLSWTTASRMFLCSMAFDGVDQTGGTTSFPNAASGVSIATLTIPSAPGHIVMNAGTGGTYGALTGTVIFSDSSSGTYINGYANYMPGASPSVTIGSAGVMKMAATDIKAG